MAKKNTQRIDLLASFVGDNTLYYSSSGAQGYICFINGKMTGIKNIKTVASLKDKFGFKEVELHDSDFNNILNILKETLGDK